MAKQKETEEKAVEKVEKKSKKKTTSVEASGDAPPAAEKPAAKSVKVGKLPPKNKSRLPRREKKAKKKAAGLL